MSDAIFVSGLALHAYHGVMQHEAKVGQTFELDLDARYRSRRRLAQRQAQATPSPTTRWWRRRREAFCTRRYRLVEAAAGAVAEAVLERSPQVRRIRVTVHKPHAPIAAIFDDVGVIIERARQERGRG